jgi:hypothetical protein
VSEHAITLKEAVGGQIVPAVLDDDLTVDELFDAEAVWAPARVRLLQRLKRENVPSQSWPQSLHWNWAKKAATLKPERLAALGDARLFGLSQSGEWQGVLWGETCELSGVEHTTKVGVPGRNLVYVSFVETAPWNWDVPPHPPDQGGVQRRRFKGLGGQLMECAVRWSEQQEFRGRVGLHALPQAEAFYRKDCGMTDLGPDAGYGGLRYFEMTEEQARQFLEGKP